MKKKLKPFNADCLIDIGKVRNNNEDLAKIFVNKDNEAIALVVCDGMGGHSYGGFAAKIAMDTFEEEFYRTKFFNNRLLTTSWLNITLRKMNREIYNTAQKNKEYAHMGTTVVIALICGDFTYILNVGDSRAYEVKFKELKLLSEDQSLIGYLDRTGQINDENKDYINKNMITNALGVYPSIMTNLFVYKNISNPIFVCSDGLYNMVSEEKLIDILHEKISVKHRLEKIINEANESGGEDNISICYWELKK